MLPQLISAGASLLGGVLGRNFQADQQEKNQALQREFAQSGIQWKVADAKKAGIHPLYALGAPSISPAVSVQSDPMGPALHSMGQDISRAVAANSDDATRATMFSNSMQQLQLERGQLENTLLKTQIASAVKRMAAGQVAPGIPKSTSGPEGPLPAHPMGSETDDSGGTLGDTKPQKGHTSWLWGGVPLRVDRRWGDAKHSEDRWGDDTFATSLYGNWVAINDLMEHYLGNTDENWRRLEYERRGRKYGYPAGRR